MPRPVEVWWEALARAEVVVDVSNSPPFEDTAVLAFFENSGRNLAHGERDAAVRHHVALSVVGADRLQDSGYFHAKLAQERLIKTFGIPYTIIRATQFFEFIGAEKPTPRTRRPSRSSLWRRSRVLHSFGR